jgi:hypothetical protein
MTNSVVGRVVDTNRRALDNVSIYQRGNLVAKTKKDGTFSITTKKADSRELYKFEAPGFVSNVRAFDPTSNGYFGVVLSPIAHKVEFDIGQGLDIKFDRSRISIPKNALVDDIGRKLSGPAIVRFTLLDITRRLQQLASSGDFFGTLSNGSLTKLESFGVFDFDIAAKNNTKAFLSKDKAISVSIALPLKIAKRAPKEIPFFEFSESSGYWEQISNFLLNQEDLTYNGTITTLQGGQYNIDVPADIVCLKFQVRDYYFNQPMPNAWVTYSGSQSNGTGTTDSNGFVCLLVVKNDVITLSATSVVGTSHYATPVPLVVTAPNFSSTAADCGNDLLCPFAGTICVDLLVGFP